MKSVDILMVGHFARDRLIVDGEGKVASGGGVYYGSIALRQLGVSVAVATRLHPKDFPYLDEMREAGVEVYATPTPATSGIANYYNSEDMERRVCKPLGFAGPFTREDIPNVDARVILITPIIAGEVDLSLLKWLATRAPVGLDVQGFIRVREGDTLVFRPWPAMAEGLRHVTYLKTDRAEAESLTQETEMQTAARTLATYGPPEIILTQSSGLTIHAEGEFHTAPFTPRSLAGRTGRGDTCFSTYVGKRLSCSPKEACRWAAKVTTLKQEQPGPWRGPVPEMV